MAKAPEYVPIDYSTLELLQHHPELQAKKDVEISNGVHGKERFSTLESAPNSPDLGSKGDRYSTLEPYSPDHDEKENPGGGLDAIAESSETPEKENWKRRRFCGVPLLLLLIGLVVVLAVVAAVVGGVVGSKKKSDDPKPASQQNETPAVVTVTQTEQIVGGATITDESSTTVATASSTSSSAPKYDEPWLTGQEDSIYNIKGFGEIPLAYGSNFDWLITKVSADDQAVYEDSYPWTEEGPTQVYNIKPAMPGSEPMYMALDSEVATLEKIDTSGATTKKIILGVLNQRVTDEYPSARAWYFRSTTKKEIARGEYPLEIYNVFLGPSWKLGIDNSSNYAPQLMLDDQGIPGEYLWKLPSPKA